MTDDKIASYEQRQAGFAPEVHNDEQDDHRAQAHTIAQDAQGLTQEIRSPTESSKAQPASDILGNATQDMVDRMRDMESSGRVDMDAFAGEPNHDDNVDKFGADAKLDGLRGDGS